MPCKLCIPPGWPPSGDTIVLRISPQRAEFGQEEEQQHHQDNIGSKDNKQMIEFYIAFFGLVAPLRLLVLISFIWTFNNIRTNISRKTLSQYYVCPPEDVIITAHHSKALAGISL